MNQQVLLYVCSNVDLLGMQFPLEHIAPRFTPPAILSLKLKASNFDFHAKSVDLLELLPRQRNHDQR